MMDGMNKIKIVPIADGDFVLAQEPKEKSCFICGQIKDNMILLRKDNNMIFSCEDHRGIIAEFVRQFGRPPIGWEKDKTGV